MRFGDVHVTVISDRERYEKADKGGTIYHLSPNTFENDKTKRTGTEWTSKVAARPYKKEDCESGLQSQLENGVQVFFVDKGTFDTISKAEDHGFSIIRNLQSENSIKNINVRQIPTLSGK